VPVGPVVFVTFAVSVPLLTSGTYIALQGCQRPSGVEGLVAETYRRFSSSMIVSGLRT